MTDKVERPEIVEEDHLKYLDDLRDSGVTNMFGAGTYLQDEFGVSKQDSRVILQYWMESFGERESSEKVV